MQHRFVPFDPPLVGAVALIALVGAIALAACGTSDRPQVASGTPVVTTTGSATTPTTGSSGDVAHGAWILTQMVVDGVPRQLVASRAPTLVFLPQDSIIAGSTGCNAYSATYTLSGETLRLGQGTLTQALCSQTVMEQEIAYLQAFRRVTRLHLANNTLTLTSSDDAVQLTFQPASGA
jgi:heat shock protein HslJ